MNTTQHFQARTQQRCISSEMVDLVLGLGEPSGNGDMTLLGRKEIDREIDRENRKHKQKIRMLEKMRSSGGAGIVSDGETLITAFYRHRKFKRN